MRRFAFAPMLVSACLFLAVPSLAQTQALGHGATGAQAQEGQEGNALTLSGTVTNWDYGEGRLEAHPYVGGAYGDPVGEGEVAADGSFSLLLPGHFEPNTVPFVHEIMNGCLMVRPEEARGFLLGRVVVFRDEESFGFLHLQAPQPAAADTDRGAVGGEAAAGEAAPGQEAAQGEEVQSEEPTAVLDHDPALAQDMLLSYAYADEETHVSGFCTAAERMRGVDLHLAPGWNLIGSRYERLSDGTLLLIEEVTTVLPQGGAWVFSFDQETYVGLGIVFEARRLGMVVTDLVSGGPAQAAGLEVGDIIVMLDGVDVRGMSEQTFMGLARGPRGSVAALEVQRAGQNLTYEVERDAVEVPPTGAH